MYLLLIYIQINTYTSNKHNEDIKHKNQTNIVLYPPKETFLNEQTKNDIKTCILSGITYPRFSCLQLESIQSSEFLFKINKKNEINKLILIKSSKNTTLDKAVEIGILRCEELIIKQVSNEDSQLHIIYKIREE
ncbi:hypothetical protein [Candidatus Kinetoplastidibacterium crithidiae]|uniref:hypothetical protein n=1 Tax=Candidatus Kinetoplastidibacterium crithidiae TaxID=33056 RepID=UPI001CEF5A00|nr:hypothetical protein [Candidatus Kinetoplastibacterium crithidii]